MAYELVRAVTTLETDLHIARVGEGVGDQPGIRQSAVNVIRVANQRAPSTGFGAPPFRLDTAQLAAIARWAEGIPPIAQVRVFGGRAKGEVQRYSDIDVAVTLVSHDPADNALRIYFDRGEGWQRELGSLLRSRVSLAWYPPDCGEQREIIDREAVIVWTR